MVSDSTTLWQLQLLRALLNSLLVWVIAKRLMPDASLRPKRIGVVSMRSAFQVAALTLFFGGAPFLTLAQMAGGLYTFPLFAGLLGFIFGEPVGPRRMVAIAAGMSGTVLVLKPGAAGISLISLMPVGAGLCYALMVITTRRLCRDESPLCLVLYTNIAVIIVGGLGMLVIPALPLSDALREQYPFLLTGNESLVMIVVVVITGCALLNTTGNLCLSKAYQIADSSFLAPIDYSYLLFASFWGVMLFGELPDKSTVSGLVLIAAAGLFVAWRERVSR